MELLEVAPVSWRTQQARVDPKKWKGHGKRMSDPLLMEYRKYICGPPRIPSAWLCDLYLAVALSPRAYHCIPIS